MAYRPIKYRKKHLTLHKAIIYPNFNAKIVIASDPWEFVDMWLKRRGKTAALFFWRQAKSFYNSSLSLSKYSSPLTAYYSMLNMTKALLDIKRVQFGEKHGLAGKNNSGSKKALLSEELVKFKPSGILAGLCRYLEESSNHSNYTLKDILYNLPFIHRAYCLTFKQPELFIPVSEPMFVKKDGSSESWFCAEIKNRKYTNKWTTNSLPSSFEQEKSEDNKAELTIRCSKRFKWEPRNAKANLHRLCNYHRIIRKHLLYINSLQCLWYIKKKVGNNDGIIERSTLVLQFAAMHRLSEMARYAPTLLAKHFKSKHNWLLSEFITTSLHQYVDEISAEITGAQIMVPGIRS